MAGIWEIVRGNTDVRLNVSLLQTELMGVALGVRTRAQAQANLETELERTLDQAESDDLTLMANEYEAGNVQSKLVYNEKAKFALNAAELELIDETSFRSVLGI
jgi:hypothetical protein